MTLSPPPVCWLHDDIEVRASPIEGRGLFATRPIPSGVVVMRLGGRIVTRAELDEMIANAVEYVDCISVEDGLDLVMAPSGHDVHFGNHSCDPTIWHIDAFTLAARRDIAADDEITIDYATQTDNAGFSFECRCASGLCRGTVTGSDWEREELRARYGDHWIPGLLRRLERYPGVR